MNLYLKKKLKREHKVLQASSYEKGFLQKENAIAQDEDDFGNNTLYEGNNDLGKT